MDHHARPVAKSSQNGREILYRVGDEIRIGEVHEPITDYEDFIIDSTDSFDPEMLWGYGDGITPPGFNACSMVSRSHFLKPMGMLGAQAYRGLGTNSPWTKPIK